MTKERSVKMLGSTMVKISSFLFIELIMIGCTFENQQKGEDTNYYESDTLQPLSDDTTQTTLDEDTLIITPIGP